MVFNIVYRIFDDIINRIESTSDLYCHAILTAKAEYYDEINNKNTTRSWKCLHQCEQPEMWLC